MEKELATGGLIAGTRPKQGKMQLVLDRFIKDFRQNFSLYVMFLPVALFFIVFHYAPMYGALIAFQDFSPIKGLLGSDWVGFKHFIDFFNSYYFWRILINTVLISLYTFIFGFPAPIILAILMNEIRSKWFQKVSQTISYIPHFIALVVVAGMIKDFTDSNGVLNMLFAHFFGGDGNSWLLKPGFFKPIYVVSEIWQHIGWDSIIYFAALMGINEELYEAVRMDGAGRFKQIWYVTLPGIMPTIIIMGILRIGQLLNVGFEKIILLENPLTYNSADVISSFVYRQGIINFDWSYSTAVNLFNSVIGIILLLSANRISRKVSDTSLW